MGALTVAKKRLTGQTFGARLRSARELAELTQAELAEKAGIHRIDVNRYENDKVMPSLEVAWMIADALGIALDDLRVTEKGE